MLGHVILVKTVVLAVGVEPHRVQQVVYLILELGPEPQRVGVERGYVALDADSLGLGVLHYLPVELCPRSLEN